MALLAAMLLPGLDRAGPGGIVLGLMLAGVGVATATRHHGRAGRAPLDRQACECLVSTARLGLRWASR
jgi:hypothetical protein